MRELEKRLVYLFTGEFFSVVTFNFIYFFYSVNPNDSLSLIFVFILLNIILLQGSFYWFVKWRSMKANKTFFPDLHKFLNILKKIDLILIGIAPIILLIEIILLDNVSLSGFILTLLIFVFAIIEYINYYHIQLTNYKNGRGRRSSIYKELDRYK